jgi:hypothetical protein
MKTDIELAEVLANKLEYCDLVGDVSYTMEDFYREQGIAKLPPTCISILIMEKAKEILERRKYGHIKA